MRATLERNKASGIDDYGNPLPSSWQLQSGAELGVIELGSVALFGSVILHCWVYNDGKRLVVDGDKTVTVEALKIALPLGIDVTNSDSITEIKNRKGAILYPGNFSINEIKRVHNHLEANLKVMQ